MYPVILCFTNKDVYSLVHLSFFTDFTLPLPITLPSARCNPMGEGSISCVLSYHTSYWVPLSIFSLIFSFPLGETVSYFSACNVQLKENKQRSIK